MTTGLIRRALACAAACTVFVSWPTLAEHVYLDDANKKKAPENGSLPVLVHDFPRVLTHELMGGVTAEDISKYDFITSHGGAFTSVERTQEQFSQDTMMLRHISGRAYQGYNFSACSISSGLAFESTTASSQGGPNADGCGIYAGHWLYKAGTRLRQSIGANDQTLAVENASRIQNGTYVVIYNSPAGSFNNAEHARVTAVNTSNDTIQVVRGFKSGKSNHASGSIVAQHVLGQGTHQELWAYNMSARSPRDASGQSFPEFYADWIGRNFLRSGNGTRTTAEIAGVMFDADFYFEYNGYNVDADNDLTVDNAMGPGGQNWLGDGLDTFYQRVTQRLSGYYVIVGVHDARGFDSAQGGQMEGWLDYGNGDFTPNPIYPKLSKIMTSYLFNMAERSQGPALVMNLTKTPTKLYPGHSSNVPSNAPFRLGLATTLIDDGYFGTHTLQEPDAWYDEYAVNVTPGSANFGKAVNKGDMEGIHQHNGWLGQPRGAFKRIYNDADFAASRSLIGNNTFDSNLTNWSAKGVTISRVATGTQDGAGALHASRMNSFSNDEYYAAINSATVSLNSDITYTLVFSARASKVREIRVELGGDSYRIPVGVTWRRYVLAFNPKSGNTKASFLVGREDSEFWLDSVYLFADDANVFRRDFDNGVALANATARARTIQVGTGFRRIDGIQDRTVNNGQAVTAVTLQPYDGILLVRAGGQTPPPTGDGVIGDLVWRDADGDGIRDAGEPGWAGATVRLLQCGGNVLATRTTNTQGNYTFANLSDGNYQVEFVKPTGANYSPYQVGNIATNSDAIPSTGRSSCVSITSEILARPGVDAGFVPTSGGSGSASIGDYVWDDRNRDGIQNSIEPGVGNVRVQLRNCNGLLIADTTTRSNGTYSFDGLAAGSYMLRFVAPSGATFTQPRAGSDIAKDSNADASGNVQCTDIGAGEKRIWIDAGLRF